MPELWQAGDTATLCGWDVGRTPYPWYQLGDLLSGQGGRAMKDNCERCGRFIGVGLGWCDPCWEREVAEHPAIEEEAGR